MAAASLEAQVIQLVAEAADVKPETVHLTTRLLDDLGMDGDDAVEFFNRVHEQFGTDLTNLHSRWPEHFGPEGLSCAAGLIFIPAVAIGGVVEMGEHGAPEHIRSDIVLHREAAATWRQKISFPQHAAADL